MDAIREGDASRAARLMRDHLVHTAELLVRQLDPGADVTALRDRLDRTGLGSMLLSGA